MRHITLTIALLSSVFSMAQASEIEMAAKDGEAHFQRCVACHLADGAGIPGAFPKLKGRLVNIVQLEGGRDYLTMIVTGGLTGPLKAAGMQYMGVMPAQSYGLNDDQVASLLNRAIVATSDGQDLASLKPFKGAEITAIKAKYTAPSMQFTRSLRPESLD